SKQQGKRAGQLTEILLELCLDLVHDHIDELESSPESNLNPLELAASKPKCMSIVQAICEHGMTRHVCLEQKAEPPIPTTKHLDNNISSSWTPWSLFKQQSPGPSSLATDSGNINGDYSSRREGSDAVQAGPPGSSDPTDNPAGRIIETTDGARIHIHILWKELQSNNGLTTCLHIAIASGNHDCAQYLAQRMHLTNETESLMSTYDRDGLTPLHLATHYSRCTDKQVDLVKTLIDCYYKALDMSSGYMTTGASSNPGNHQMKLGLTPYKYFIESREQATNSAVSREQTMNNSLTSRSRGGQRTRSANNTKPLVPVSESAVKKMNTLLRLSCMRYYGRDRGKFSELLGTNKQIHLDPNPRTEVNAKLLDYLAEMKFEQYLQYVFIPNLRVRGVKNTELEKQEWWESQSRKDCAYIFEWLRTKLKVEKIIRITVEDDPTDFHSDEVIEYALRGFDIEEWNWVKWDLCSETIYNAAPNVRDVDLYWSGNKAILKSWAAEDGLVKLKQDILSQFEQKLEQAWSKAWAQKPPKVIIQRQAHITQSLSRMDLEEKGRKERWLRCTENFSQLLEKWFNNELAFKDQNGAGITLVKEKEIRVAVIDDGANIDLDDLHGNIVAGETFYDNSGHWPGFYQSSYGHGHEMACIIRQLCPQVKLFIAKLNELWMDGKPQITPESAANAIEWACGKDVDIISMSWTIEHVDTDAEAKLKAAIDKAIDKNILLFCACDDQGNLSDHPYPARTAKDEIFKIGSATMLGTRHKGTNEGFFDFIAPGSEDTSQAGSTTGVAVSAKPRFGSSIATARCAGLAAMILQCLTLMYNPGQLEKSAMRKRGNVKSMFNKMVDENDKNKYIKVWNILDNAINHAEMTDLEGSAIANVAREFISCLVPCPTTQPNPVPSIIAQL
ncbi:hypothetical protein F5Y12DRAFT_791763, partial [Xylaria sp. FL1777]